MIFLWAGLQDIPQHIQEAAEIDGANRFQRFLFVTLPLLRRPLLFVLVTDTATNFLLFVPMFLLTGGGPAGSTNVLMFEAYKSGFVYGEMGRSLAIVAGYTFAVLRFPGRNVLFFLIVLTFLVPFEAIAIPLYTVVRSIGWLDTYQGLIGPGVANGIVIFLFRQFFAQIPRELAESARLEGASWVTILFRIYLPLSKPVVISAALLIFLFQWESFLWPLIATRSENLKVIQVALAGFEERYVTLWNELFAAAIVAASSRSSFFCRCSDSTSRV